MPASVQYQGTRQVFGPGGKVRFFGLAGGVGPSSTVQSFTIKNDGGATHGFLKFGLCFKDGACPSGSVPTIKRGGSTVPAQFDRRVTNGSGDLKFAICTIRDSDWTAIETSRSYDVEVGSGSYDNTADLTLSDVTSNYDFKVTVSNCEYYVSGSTGTFRTRNDTASGSTDGDRCFIRNTTVVQERQSGSFVTISADGTRTTANGDGDFNTHSATSARLTKIYSGPICEGWKCWGYVGTDTDLVVYHYVELRKNSDGSIHHARYAPVMELCKWKSTTKALLNYDATVKDGATTLASYTNLWHAYHQTGLLGSKATDVNEQRPHTVGVTADKLIYVGDWAYWTDAGFLDPHDWSYSPNALSTILPTNSTSNGTVYIPFKNMGEQSAPGAPGDYIGRGTITQHALVAAQRGAHADYRLSRINALAGLSLPQHFRDDSSYLIKALILQGHGNTSGDYDFTGDGMDTAVHAYMDSRTATSPTDYTDSYGSMSGGSGFYGYPEGGCGFFDMITNPGAITNTHRPPYTYWQYLVEGEDYYLQSEKDLANATVQILEGESDSGASPATLHPRDTTGIALSAEQFSAIATGSIQNVRQTGWAVLQQAHGAALTPDEDPEQNYLKALYLHNLKYLSRSITEAHPTALNNAGVWETYYTYYAPYMENFILLCAAHSYRLLGNSEALAVVNYGLTRLNAHVAKGTYVLRSSRSLSRLYSENVKTYDSSGNPFLAAANHLHDFRRGYTIDTGTDEVVSDTLYSAPTDGVPWQVGDTLTFTDMDDTGQSATVSTDVTAGNTYHVIAVGTPSGGTQRIQVSATSGGSAINFTDNPGSRNTATVDMAAWDEATPSTGWTPLASHYEAISYAALVMGYTCGGTGVTSSAVDTVETFLGSTDWSDLPIWKYKRTDA